MASNPRSLANLRPWRKGQPGNPNGRPKTAKFRRAMGRVLFAQVERSSSDGKATALECLLEDVVNQGRVLATAATNLGELAAILPLLRLIQETFDGKIVPAPAIEAKKTSSVYLIGGEVTKREEVQSVTETVRVETEESNA